MRIKPKQKTKYKNSKCKIQKIKQNKKCKKIAKIMQKIQRV